MEDQSVLRRFCLKLFLGIGLVLCLSNDCLTESYQFEYETDPEDSPLYDNGPYLGLEGVGRLTRSGHAADHNHKSPQEEFQCMETKKALSGEGSSGDVDEVCQDEKRKEILASVHKLGCRKPILKVVKLKSPGPNFELLPNVAHVWRCGGHCSSPKVCKAKTTRKIRIPVFQIDRTTRQQSCVNYELEEHVDCHCGCAIQTHHCTEQQTYNPHHCSCSCDNSEERESCMESSKMTERFWDDASCKCSCKTQICSLPMVWVPYLCKCARVSEVENMLF